MPAKVLTDAFVRTRKPPRPERGDPRQVTYINTLDRGLALVLVVSYGGAKTFRVLTYINGKPVTRKLGTYPHMSLAEAKKQARAYFDNPQAFREQAETGTFKQVAEDWFKRHVEKQGILSAYEIRRQLDKYVYPKWASTKFLDIRRGQVVALLDHVEDNSSAAMADGVLATVRAIMTWYQARHEDYVSPIVRGMHRNKTKKARARILTDNEIRRVWEAAAECGTFGALVKTLLLTAQRKEKVTTMRWDDLADGVWTIRSEQREKGTAGSLQLPPLALAVIDDQAQHRRLASNPYVFPGNLRGRPRSHEKNPGPPTFNSFSRAKRDLDVKLGDVPGWVLHDLRRTARSLMARAGVRPDIAERVLGHAIAGVEGVYDRHSYADEKADALNRLAALVETITNPPSGNVVPLPTGRRTQQ
jgi:integrase